MKNPLHHIHRKDTDSNNTHSWVVLFQRHNLNVRRVFSDSVWGGKRKALAAAKAFRDEQLDSLTSYVYEIGRRNVMRRNNRSGVVGVARYERPPAPGGKYSYIFWQAGWIDEHGRTRTRKFSVRRWGERGAKQMALEVRRREIRRAVAARTGLED
ncbi:hypothetical protein [Caenimonas aquaedulcis]|uniref:AP2 domain-containing protein n=1 Tax=Caenimonas aquaedulcis TaxID=2793270 RepID=A0A931MIQ9_9BURK|nr:hypothetical protein [Caenimonas aquaedulcis]MBG9390406.1 AP2 domain-containing protein [Caenimonas aquaedulcis]